MSLTFKKGVMENPLYREPGPGIKFSKLSDYLAENFPREKLKRLKNLLQGRSFPTISILIILVNYKKTTLIVICSSLL